MPTAAKRTIASRELDKILDEDGPTANAIKSYFDGKRRSILWTLRTGRRKPALETAIALRRLSHGRLLEEDWFQAARRE